MDRGDMMFFCLYIGWILDGLVFRFVCLVILIMFRLGFGVVLFKVLVRGSVV